MAGESRQGGPWLLLVQPVAHPRTAAAPPSWGPRQAGNSKFLSSGGGVASGCFFSNITPHSPLHHPHPPKRAVFMPPLPTHPPIPPRPNPSTHADHAEEGSRGPTSDSPVSDVYAPAYNATFYTLSVRNVYRRDFIVDFTRIEALPVGVGSVCMWWVGAWVGVLKEGGVVQDCWAGRGFVRAAVAWAAAGCFQRACASHRASSAHHPG